MPNILIVKFSSLGDVIHTFPVISDIKNNVNGDLLIDWVVEEGYQTLPKWLDFVNEVIVIGLRRWWLTKKCSETPDYLKALRSKEYDAIIDVQGLVKSAIFGAVPARGPSHGYDTESIRERLASHFYTHKHRVSKQQHAVTRSRQLAALALGYPVPDSPPDYGIKLETTQKQDNVILVPHTAQERKLWPTDKWVELGKMLVADGLQVEVTWGNEVERQRAIQIADACGGRVAKSYQLDEMPNYIASTRGMVSLDTGLAHIAAAVALPNVCLCVATDPKLSGAFGVNQDSVGNAGNLSAKEVQGRLDKLLASSTT